MISFIANHFSALNGADLMSRDILRGLLAAKIPLTVVSSDPPEAIGLTQETGARLQWMPPPPPIATPTPSWLGPLRRTVSRISEHVALCHDAEQLERNSSRGLIVNGFGNDWVFRYLPRLPAETPRALIMHDSPRRFVLKDQPPLNWALEKMERYSHFIFCSQRVAREWLETGALVGKQHCCIPNCCREDDVLKVSARDRRAVRAQIGLPGHGFVVVCPATLQYRKGQDLLLDSLPVLASALPELQLCLVGTALGDWGASLTQRVRNSEFRSQVQVLGPRQDALEFIYAADAVVLPSRSEAAPLTVLEAMALKTPVIAAAVGGVPELLEHGHSGLLFSPENRYELVQLLISLARDPSRRKWLAENASQRYWKYFSRNHLMTGYAGALRCLVTKQPWTVATPDEA